MKRMIFSLTLLGAALSIMSPVQAQEYPSKPIKMIVPFAPGGTTDALARLIAEKLRGKWGQPVIVENRAGAAGNIGAEAVSRATPDGYTLMFTPGGPLAINKSLYRNLSFDPGAFAPVSLIAKSPTVLVVSPNVKAGSLPQLIAFAKENPGRLNYASQGNGSVAHLVAESFNLAAGTKMIHVPYKGSGPALAAVLGGEVDLGFLELSGVLPHIRPGKLRVLAVGSENRYSFLPDVPAMSETLPGFVTQSWFGIVAPPGTASQVTTKLSGAIAEIVRQPDLAKWMLDHTVDAVGSTPAEMAQFIAQDKERYDQVIRASKVSASAF